MKKAKLTVLVEDSIRKTEKARGLNSGHGLSILVEASKPKVSILMDTGPSPSVLLRNMEILGIDPESIDAVFLSHGHYDHTGGLLGILEKAKKGVPVIAHPEAFGSEFKVAPKLRYIGSPVEVSKIESSASFVLARTPVTIAEGVMTTGEIDRVTPYESPRGFWTVRNERFAQSAMPDDQALILNLEEKGLVIVTGCAHAGIVNTIKHSQKLTKTRKVHAIVGGFHMHDYPEERIKATINNLAEINPRLIYPCHCTGSRPTRRFIESFNQRCHPIQTGDTFEI
jgi:7,8-dihydropterin-6-yl-methyl-4-(beta-D-ribofuranosyl)aminobenzene 5'-phosphate synthase